MKTEARACVRFAVERVADDGMAQVCTVYPQLVGAARERLKLHERRALSSFEHAQARLCGLAFGFDSPLRMKLRIAPNRRINQALILLKEAMHQRQIKLLDE